MKILAIDPGIYNFAYCVIDDKSKIISIGHLDNPIQSIKKDDLEDNLKLFSWGIKEVIQSANLKKDDFVVIERYQARGHKGSQIECVNIMIGIIADMIDNNLILVMPGTWKVYMKKNYGMGKKGSMKKILNLENVTDHMADSVGIAAHAFERYFNIKIMEPLLKETI